MNRFYSVFPKVLVSLAILFIALAGLFLLVKKEVFSIDQTDPCPTEYAINEYSQCVKLNIEKQWSSGLPGGIPVIFFDEQSSTLYTLIAGSANSYYNNLELSNGFKLYKTDLNGGNVLVGSYDRQITGYVNRPDGLYVTSAKYLGWNSTTNQHEHDFSLARIDKASGQLINIYTEIKNNFPYVDLAIDSKGDFYTNDISAQNVVKITANGSKSSIATTSLYPARVTIDTNDNVYIISVDLYAESGQITKINSNGVISNFMQFSTGEVPTDLEINKSGKAYLTTMGSVYWDIPISKLYEVDLNSGSRSKIADVGVNIPLFLDFDSKGNIYLPYFSEFDYDVYAPGIMRITPNGNTKLISLDSTFSFTIAIDNQDNIYVASNFSATKSYDFYQTTISKINSQSDTIINKTTPVYRFFNNTNGAHLYTTSTTERDTVKGFYYEWSYEGSKFYVEDNPGIGKVAVYRFWNNKTGAHLYTISDTEKDQIIKTLPNFVYEGVKFYVYTNNSIQGLVPVYRFFNKQNGAHLYTNSEEERSTIQYTLPKFNFEGEKFFVYK